jgi:hypothetical protein
MLVTVFWLYGCVWYDVYLIQELADSFLMTAGDLDACHFFFFSLLVTKRWPDTMIRSRVSKVDAGQLKKLKKKWNALILWAYYSCYGLIGLGFHTSHYLPPQPGLYKPYWSLYYQQKFRETISKICNSKNQPTRVVSI